MAALYGLFIFAVGSLLIALGGVFFVRHKDQRWHDRQRYSYSLVFPSPLDTDAVNAWLGSLHGMTTKGLPRLTGVPSVALEVTGSKSGITHRIDIPYDQRRFVTTQLQSTVAGVRISLGGTTPQKRWDHVVELGLTNSHRTLRVKDVEVLAHRILATIQPMRGQEEVTIQVIVSPALHQKPPPRGQETASFNPSFQAMFFRGHAANRDEIEDRRAKLSESTFLAVIRVAARAATKAEAKARVADVCKAISTASGPHTKLKSTILTFVPSLLHHRMVTAKAPITFPMQLTLTELSALMGWPHGQPHLAGMPQGRRRQLAATGAIPRSNGVVGISDFPGDERYLAVTPANKLRHTHIVGQIGSRKTTLLGNMAIGDINRGHGLVVLDPKGDLVERVADSIPKERFDDTIIIDLKDTERPIGLNLLQGDPEIVVGEIQEFFNRLYPEDARALIVPESFFFVLTTLMTSTTRPGPLTIADIKALCVPTKDQVKFSEQIIQGMQHNPDVWEFWQGREHTGRRERDTYFGPMSRRIWRLTSQPVLKNILGQSDNTIDIFKALTSKKIILVDVSGKGDPIAKLLGSLIFNWVWMAVRSGATDPKDPTPFYIDEAHMFLNTPASLQDTLNLSRSKGLPLVLAHQYLEQLDRVREMKAAFKASTATKIALGPMEDDAREFAHSFGPRVSEHDFRNQQNGEFIAKLATDTGISSPVTGQVLSPFLDHLKPTGSAKKVREQSRQQWGRPKAEIEAAIAARWMIETPEPEGLATVGKQRWIREEA